MSSDSITDNYPDLIETIYEFKIPAGQIPQRLDVFLTNNIKYATRTKVQNAIAEGFVEVNNKIVKSSRKIKPNDTIICKILKPPPIQLIPENIPLNVVFEDDVLLVVNKPAGMVTHPGFGNRSGTLVNAILYHIGQRDSVEFDIDEDSEEDYNAEARLYASEVVRPGIIHRLDKDTSGLLVIVKDSKHHPYLAKQFADRIIERYYNALVWGDFKENEGTFSGNIGRNPRNRKLFAVVKNSGKHALTDFWVLERFGIFTLLKIKLRTGRTHQIRVHLSNAGHPLVGDKDYGGDKILFGTGQSQTIKLAQKIIKLAKRQLLHAKSLGFFHPISKEMIFFNSELPDDFQDIITILQQYKKSLNN
jgi:23S rRNA pseudouridine1911/1915/1917 synthase